MAEKVKKLDTGETIGLLNYITAFMLVPLSVFGIETGSNLLNRIFYSAYPNKLPDIFTLVGMRLKQIISDSEYVLTARESGYDIETAHSMLENQRAFANIQDLLLAKHRGFIDEKEYREHPLTKQFRPADVELLDRLSYYFPSVPDLVRFAVREVYSPAIVSKFGQMEDIPKKYLEEAGKVGLPEDQANNYWAAHWDLPSPMQGFEMLHRGVINEDELRLLLRALDIMPFWRDKLTKISYRVLTRVDVRRMYRIGTLDEKGVLNAYLEIGYSPENAQLMTDFTIKYENVETQGLTLSKIAKAYKQDLIDEEQFKEYLSGLGYPDSTKDFYIDMIEFEKIQDETEFLIDELENRFLMGDIDESTLSNELNTLDLPSTYVKSVVSKIILKISKKRKMPTKADLGRWYKKDIIRDVEYIKKMEALGYTKDDTLNYLELLQPVT